MQKMKIKHIFNERHQNRLKFETSRCKSIKSFMNDFVHPSKICVKSPTQNNFVHEQLLFFCMYILLLYV